MASAANKGMCKRCGQRPLADGKTKCVSCLAQAIRSQRAVRERAKKGRRCIRCYKKLADEVAHATCPACVEKHRRSHQEWVRKLKHEVFAHYGGPRCACCGETGLAFLSLDHVAGNGAEQRKELGLTGLKFYRWLKKQGFPSGFQVLCMGCNWAKRRHRFCPHQLIREKPPAQPGELCPPDWTI